MIDRFEIVVSGGRTRLEWGTTSAASITIKDDSNTEVHRTDTDSAVERGGVYVSPTITTTYTLTADRAGRDGNQRPCRGHRHGHGHRGG